LPVQPTGGAFAPALQPAGVGYNLLYSFTGYPSGGAPTGLTVLDGALYGTTTSGGTKTFGTVFVRSSAGKVRVLYNFRGGNDGAEPTGKLVAIDGALYGTTEYGGARGDGTVFKVSRSGDERVIHTFKGGSDGANPLLAGLAVIDGALYGTTHAGGDPSCHVQNIVGCGTAFKLSTSGQELVLHRFKGKLDGACPAGSLTTVGATLYGTTNFGGPGNNGTVFQLSTSGVEHVLYRFKGYPDGAQPYAGLTALNGEFYGATALGGAFDYSGTVFELSTSGVEHVLYSFHGYPDGAVPYAALTAYHGELYGTTAYGGDAGRACTGGGIVGCGTVFTVSPSGEERVLYRFKGTPDGKNPWSSFIFADGLLVGTTLSGGADAAGGIFRIAAPR
jgi:uncharacterized repeat protein (TIGR03803 family)